MAGNSYATGPALCGTQRIPAGGGFLALDGQPIYIVDTDGDPVQDTDGDFVSFDPVGYPPGNSSMSCMSISVASSVDNKCPIWVGTGTAQPFKLNPGNIIRFTESSTSHVYVRTARRVTVSWMLDKYNTAQMAYIAAPGIDGAPGTPGVDGAPGVDGDPGATGPAGPVAEVRVIPAAHVFNSERLIIGDTDAQELLFDSEYYDSDSIHSMDTNTGCLSCKTSGVYLVIASIAFETNIVGTRYLSLHRTPAGGGTIIEIARQQMTTNATNGGAGLNISKIVEMFVGDFLQCRAYQNSGGVLYLHNTPEFSPEFQMIRLGPPYHSTTGG